MSVDTRELQRRITNLEEDLEELKRLVRRLFVILDASTDEEPFLRLMITLNATEAQESAVYDLMNAIDEQLAQDKPALDHVQFTNRIHQIFPDHRQHLLPESIVNSLAKEGDWDRVYEHLRQSGLNLRDLREERGY